MTFWAWVDAHPYLATFHLVWLSLLASVTSLGMKTKVETRVNHSPRKGDPHAH